MIDVGQLWEEHHRNTLLRRLWRRAVGQYFPVVRVEGFMARMRGFDLHCEDGWGWAQRGRELHIWSDGNLFHTLAGARRLADAVAEQYGYAVSCGFLGGRKTEIITARLGFIPAGQSGMLQWYVRGRV